MILYLALYLLLKIPKNIFYCFVTVTVTMVHWCKARLIILFLWEPELLNIRGHLNYLVHTKFAIVVFLRTKSIPLLVGWTPVCNIFKFENYENQFSWPWNVLNFLNVFHCSVENMVQYGNHYQKHFNCSYAVCSNLNSNQGKKRKKLYTSLSFDVSPHT